MPRTVRNYLPRAHYDHASAKYPRMVARAEADAASAGDEGVSYTSSHVIGDPQFAVIRSLLAEEARKGGKAMGYPMDGTTDDEALSVMPADVRQSWGDMFVADWVTLFNFARFGKKTFHVSGNLAERLLDTDLNVPVEQFSLPFPSCLFVFNDQATRDALWAIKRSEKPAPTRGAVSVFIFRFNNDKGEERLGLYAYHYRDDELVAGCRREMWLTPGSRIEDVLRTEHPLGVKEPMPNDIPDRVFFEEGLRFIRLAINSVLYLSSAEPDLAVPERPSRPSLYGALPAKQRRAIAEEEKSWTALEYIDVGRSLPAMRGLPPAPGAGRELAYRMKVRGHWKTQAHGPGLKERKIILVEPYWRGPDAAEVVSRPYRMR